MLSFSEYVRLPDGRLVRAELWARLLLLHTRGFTFTPERGGALAVRPAGRLTTHERAWLLERKADVLALLRTAPGAPLPPGWQDVHTMVGTIDELVSALDEAHAEADAARRAAARRRVH